jgi:hypothetical protein
MTLSQTVALGNGETNRMVWNRSDEEERVSNPALIRIAMDFHHTEVARWLLQEQLLWVDLGRLFARETRAFDVLLRLPKGGEALPELGSVNQVGRNSMRLLGGGRSGDRRGGEGVDELADSSAPCRW